MILYLIYTSKNIRHNGSPGQGLREWQFGRRGCLVNVDFISHCSKTSASTFLYLCLCHFRNVDIVY